jgi:hypothetical protein
MAAVLRTGNRDHAESKEQRGGTDPPIRAQRPIRSNRGMTGWGSPRRERPEQHPSRPAGGHVAAHELATGTRGVAQRRLVDVELVSFGVGQRDRVVVQALLDVRMQSRSTERHEPRRLGLDPLASRVE